MKKTLAIVLCFVVVVMTAVSVSAAFAEQMYVSGNKVRERNAPSTDSTIVGMHNKGKELEVVATVGDWAQLDNGNYVSLDYLVTESEAEAVRLFDNLPMYVIGDGVRERSSMDLASKSNIVTVHSVGEVVYVAEKLTGWYRLTNGNYMSADYLSADYQDIALHYVAEYDDIVFVYISEQYVEYYQNQEIIAKGFCVTGDSKKSPTPTGLYTIGVKRTDFDMNGNPNTHTEYASFFNGGIAFHDAPWRSQFGGTIYQGSGSHGCINCDLELAKTIYENCVSGQTRVLVLP